jgi:Zn-dependent protease with chaperone function
MIRAGAWIIIFVIQAPTRQCPNCQNVIPVDTGYPVWCDRCEWNLDVPARGRARNWRQRLYLRVSAGMSKRLLWTITRAGPSAPTFTISKLLALLLASFVYIGIVALGISGIRLLLDHSNSFLILTGIVLVMATFMLRPHFGKVPRHNVLSREHFPTLYKLTDDIAVQLGTKRVDAIVISTRFNAFFYKAGLLRRNFLGLGIPLLVVLTPQERVALIGHELAHSANGDASRSFVIANAIRSLNVWQDLLAGGGELQFLSVGLCLMLAGTPWFIATFLGLIGTLLALLLASDSQRAEYLADSMAARAGGTQAMLNVLHKLHMEDALWMAMRNYYDIGGKENVFEILRRRVERVPPREVERVARIEKLVASRLDATHPPTAYRIQLLQAWPVAQPEIVMSSEEIDAIERELSSIKPDLEDIMLQDYRRRTNY